MTLLIVATLLVLAALTTGAPRATAHSVRFGHGTPRERVLFLEGRLAHHRYVCANGARLKHTRWHCSARRWTGRELREAHADQAAYDNAVPEWPWLAIARCENPGTGVHGVNWDAYNAQYEGGYGFAHSTWRQFRYPDSPATANVATPREQTRVARRLRARFGGYSPWPACHVRLGLPG